jgi:hypothetical protein
VRLSGLLAALALSVAACGQPSALAPLTSTSAQSNGLNPARVDQVRADLPPGYEVAALPAKAAPAAFWGLGADWTADPPPCGWLGDLHAEAGTTRGWSASGAGGIVYVVAAASSAALDPAVRDECARWTASAGHTAATVTEVPAPAIDGVATVGMSASATTVVEGGTETHSHADTFTGYLSGYVVSVTIVSDPGSPNPQLGQEFASELLVRTVSALRG